MAKRSASANFASANLTIGQINAVVKKLGGEKGVLDFLRGKLAVSKSTHRWREENGVIYLSVTSDGTTGPHWIKRLKDQGFRLGSSAEKILLSPLFNPTYGITTEIGILRGDLFEGKSVASKNVLAEARKRRFISPDAEIACLIREALTDEDIEAMGLVWVVVMHDHELFEGYFGDLLGVGRGADGRWLTAYRDDPANGWIRGGGFAYAVSQVSQINSE